MASTSTRPSKLDTMKSLAKGQTTAALVESLLMVDAMLEAGPATTEDGQALRITCAVIRGELENRFPAASAALEAAFEQADEDGSDVDYSAVLLANVQI